MTYVLISLVGDQATQEADIFASLLAKRRFPTRAFHEASPSHGTVTEANGEVRRAVIVGHNGRHQGTPSLRAYAKGSPWADGTSLGSMFAGARVYAYACETMGVGGVADVTALGHEARRAGVGVFAGHAVTVPAGWQQELKTTHAKRVTNALAEMIFAFLDGEDDANKLRLVARGSFNVLEAGIPLDISEGLEAFQLPLAIERAVEHLFVAA